MAAKLRNGLMTAVLSLFALYYLLEYSNINPIRTAGGKGIFALVMIVLLIAFSTDRKAEKVSINKVFMAVYLIFPVWMLIMGAIHPLREGWIIYAVTMLVMPAFFIAWAGRGDYGTLFDSTASAWTVAGFEYYLLCVICLPPDDIHYFLGRYTGLTRNPNILGMLTVTVLACSLYLLLRNRMQVLSVLSAGLSLAVVWLTGSRTAFIADAAVLTAFIIMFLREREMLQKGKTVPAIGLCLALIVAVTGMFTAKLPAEKLGYTGITELREITDSDQKFTDEELQELGVDVPAGSISAEDTLLGSLFTVVYAESYPEEEYSLAEGETPGDPDDSEGSNAGERLINTDSQYGLTNGRAEIWLQVLQQINLTGHDPDTVLLYYNGEEMQAAHNSVLDFTFVCGAPAGILWLILELIAAVYAFGFLFGKKEYPEAAALAVMLITGYGIESLLEVQILFGNRHLVLLFFIALAMVAARPLDDENGTTEPSSE